MMNTSTSKYLEISNVGGILVIAIANPPNNTLSHALFAELEPCLELIASPDVGAVLFTGKGSCFSKGADRSEIEKLASQRDHQSIVRGNEIFTFISNLTKPTIAAINGACFGGGLELALACHLRVCSEKARIGLPELNIGVIPGLGGIQRLIRVVGEARALELILLGDMISASRAYEISLVSRIFPKKDFLSRALAFTKTILAVDREAIEEVLKLAARARPENELENIDEASRAFLRLVSKRMG